MNRLILLSFDIEEFDVPEEYGQTLDERVKLEVSLAGLKAFSIMLEETGLAYRVHAANTIKEDHGAVRAEWAAVAASYLDSRARLGFPMAPKAWAAEVLAQMEKKVA